jgi:hypothetical protein
MLERFLRSRMPVALGALMIAALAGCAGMTMPSRVDCNIVRLQTQAGRSEPEIAAALGVTVAEVQGCASMASAKGSSGGAADTSAYISAGQAAGAVTSTESEAKPKEEEKPPWAY